MDVGCLGGPQSQSGDGGGGEKNTCPCHESNYGHPITILTEVSQLMKCFQIRITIN
jgi:hypothetical protein